MEEILASIRRIIAEEPLSKPARDIHAPATGVLPPNPLFSTSSARPTFGPERPASNAAASLGRVVEALDQQAGNNEPAGGKLKSAIDEDLAELLGERAMKPAAETAAAAPAASPFENADAAWRALEDKMGTKLAPNTDVSAVTAQTAAAAVSHVREAEAKPAAAPFFPSMRSSPTGFYPPQGAHLAKPIVSAAPEASAASSEPSGTDLPAPTGAAISASAINGTGLAATRASAVSSAPAELAANQPSVPLPPRPISIETPPASTFPPAVARPALTPSPSTTVAPGPLPSVDTTTAEGANALGALAVGLAASSATTPAAARSSEPAKAEAPTAQPAPAPVRSLEDAVADMLKPLLQQWLAENMPRIIEKALRVEMARTSKDDPKN
jgi:cell pole-organizing protein PopZ